MDCGPTCLRMIARYYGKHYNADTIRQKSGFSRQGVSMLGISETAEKIGFRTRGVQLNFERLHAVMLPVILHWDQNHFVVLVRLSEKKAVIADPANGIITYKKTEFLKHWLSTYSSTSAGMGTLLLLEPTSAFYKQEGEKEHRLNWSTILQYMRQNSWQVTQVMICLLVGSLLQLIFPFLMQSMVDTGINTRNMQYITIVLFAQLTLTLSSTIISFLRSRIQLRISNSVNISILSDFWIKLNRLPLYYFDLHHAGDTFQRINDNRQVQSFITGEGLSAIISLLNFIVYAVILMLYSVPVFLIFIVGNALYLGWIRLFLPIRRKINYDTFHLSTKENNATLQMVLGMQEIRSNNAEQSKRWEWENIQASIFKLNFKSLNYSQWQSTGALFITQGKDIIISFMAAQLVVEGKLTFGTMLAVQYILGQLTGPVMQFISLSQSLQDAKISIERLNEIHQMEDEEPVHRTMITTLPYDKSIRLKSLSFTFPGAGNTPVLNDISITIPEGKITAIVGASGSGKTTLLKLLQKVYLQYEGEIKIGENNFRNVSPSFWRSQCGTVMQDGYIFNDTIARNIAVGQEYIDYDKLIMSCRVANILPFIESLPNDFNTQLGSDGISVSQGQKQRLLIARAVYKQPEYLFFDEATNSLDADGERTIVENLNVFFKKRTVVIVAHRLSTVVDADNIVVLHNGRIVEEGNHEDLVSLQGRYFELVKNQLKLGI